MASDPPLTKRKLGWLLLAAGVSAGLISLGVHIIRAGLLGPFGPIQQQVLGAAALAVVLGLSLLPRGNRPA